MKVSFKRLRHILVDRGMSKTDLRVAANISSATLASIMADRSVSLTVLLKVCEIFSCDFADIMEAVPESGESKQINSRSCFHKKIGAMTYGRDGK